VVWLAFFTRFPQSRLSKRWRMALTIAPLVIFGLPIAASAIDIIYSPSVLANSWPIVLSAAPVSVIQDITGVVPLLFLSAVPFNSPIVQARFLELWFMIAVLYFALGFLMLIVSYRRLDEPQKRRRVGMLCVAVGIFEVVTIHNILIRNWGSWFGTAPPMFFPEWPP